MIELSPKRICHGRLALLGPHGDAISTRLDASLTKTEEVAKVLDLQKNIFDLLIKLIYSKQTGS